jgi:hypothetical protein
MRNRACQGLLSQLIVSMVVFLSIGPWTITLGLIHWRGTSGISIPHSFHEFIVGFGMLFFISLAALLKGFPVGLVAGASYGVIQYTAVRLWFRHLNGHGKPPWFSLGLGGGLITGSIVSVLISLGSFDIPPIGKQLGHLYIAYIPSIVCGLVSSLLFGSQGTTGQTTKNHG